MNAPENTERPEDPSTPADAADAEETTSPDSPTSPAAADDDAAGAPETGTTSLYVRRSRTPTLGFWVALAIAVPAVAALISAPFFDFADLGGVLNFVLIAAVFVGLPLAAIAALVDAIRHRRSSPRRR